MTRSFWLYCACLIGISLACLTACKKTQVNAIAAKGTQNSVNKLAFYTKVNAHLPIKIACEGTSLTYGQNVPGVELPINGASQTRAMYQYPSTLQLTLQATGLNVNVINRGFPGDRTTEGLSRWQDSTVADICILEYGTNDAFNFGGYATGTIPIPTFTNNLTQLVTRRLNQGAWVIITSPPDVDPVDTTLNAYKVAIKAVALKYDLPVFDVEKSVITGSSNYFDGVHLTAAAYQKWGIAIAPLVYIK
jgi:lysophospholipase L1-like esterase